MLLDLQKRSPAEIYFAFTQTIVPRPIAWVLSESANATYNLAPFSYFNAIGSAPPVLVTSCGHKRSGEKKDTWRNIEERDHHVIHIASVAQAEALNASAATLDHGDSEVEHLGLPTTDVPGWSLPRLSDAPVAFFCQRYAIHEIGTQGMILSQVCALHIDDALVSEQDGRLKVDAARLNPLARLGGLEYAQLGEIIALSRPG